MGKVYKNTVSLKIDIVYVLRFSLQREFERISETKSYKNSPRYEDIKGLSDEYLEDKLRDWAKRTGRTVLDTPDFQIIAQEIIKELQGAI